MNDRYLKEYRCGPCRSTEILLNQNLGTPANGELCPKCSTRMLLIRIQPMSCATQQPWEFVGSRMVQNEKMSLPSMWAQAKAAIMGTTAPQSIQETPVLSQEPSYRPALCSNCFIELSPESLKRNAGLGNDGTLGKPRYCDVCDSIVKSMATSPGLIEAHENWESEQHRKRGLIDGRV